MTIVNERIQDKIAAVTNKYFPDDKLQSIAATRLTIRVVEELLMTQPDCIISIGDIVSIVTLLYIEAPNLVKDREEVVFTYYEQEKSWMVTLLDRRLVGNCLSYPYRLKGCSVVFSLDKDSTMIFHYTDNLLMDQGSMVKTIPSKEQYEDGVKLEEKELLHMKHPS
jgi:hypothetical protein